MKIALSLVVVAFVLVAKSQAQIVVRSTARPVVVTGQPVKPTAAPRPSIVAKSTVAPRASTTAKLVPRIRTSTAKPNVDPKVTLGKQAIQISKKALRFDVSGRIDEETKTKLVQTANQVSKLNAGFTPADAKLLASKVAMMKDEKSSSEILKANRELIRKLDVAGIRLRDNLPPPKSG